MSYQIKCPKCGNYDALTITSYCITCHDCDHEFKDNEQNRIYNKKVKVKDNKKYSRFNEYEN